MDKKDRIGRRGELIFAVKITKWCGGEQWFDENFSGDKAELKDFSVELIDPPNDGAVFYAQIKSTTRGTFKKGQKLYGTVKPAVLRKMKKFKIPVYIVGVDLDTEIAYIVSAKGAPAKLNGIPTKHPINCTTIQELWNEVNEYWQDPIGHKKSSYFR